MPFGEQVRALREARKLTQRELADRLGVSVSYISKVENEKLHFGRHMQRAGKPCLLCFSLLRSHIPFEDATQIPNRLVSESKALSFLHGNRIGELSGVDATAEANHGRVVEMAMYVGRLQPR
jgi:transcriptional regulator with XRE-family HTH domain